jgi:zinc transporter 2
MRKLCIVSFVSVFFIIAQLIGGYMAHSIAIFTDSAHLASDLIGFAISMISLRMAQRPATKHLSYGFHRAEVIGTLVSIIFIWGLTVWLLYEATLRILEPVEVMGMTMFIVAWMGLGFNLIQMKILHSGDGHYHLGGGSHDDHDHGHDHAHGDDHAHNHDHAHEHKAHDSENQGPLKEPLVHSHEGHSHNHAAQADSNKNINVTSAYLHVLGDMLMSVGVIIAATVIWIFPEAEIADPICTYLFSVIICFTTLPVFKDCVNVMMEATPTSIDIEELEEDILAIAGVHEIHDLHVWAISVGKHSLSAHLSSDQPLKTLSQVTDLCRRKYKLFHTTIQVEGTEGSQHYFACENDLHD